jgi:hypothetical protein
MQENPRSYAGKYHARMRAQRSHSGAAIQPEHVPGVRKVLRAHGYQVDASGPLTDRLLSAWRNYRRAIKYGTGRGRGTGDNSQPGAHKVSDWNKLNPRKYGSSSGALHTIRTSPPAKKDFVADAAKRTDTHAKAKAHADHLGVKSKRQGGSTGGAGMPGMPAFGTDVNKLLPQSFADKLAGLQFDPQIAEARRALAGQGRDAAQAQADIGNWYGQVESSQKTAGERDVAAGDRARGDISSLVQGIVQSLGGSRGAGVVGAAGANDLTAVAQQGQAQDTFNADLAPILASEQAGAASRQRALASQQAMKLQGDVTDLVGQKGGARAQALMQIMQANNQGRQANFGNKLALNNAALAAASLGLDAAKTKAMLAQYGLQNAYQRARNKAASKAANPHADWASLDASQKDALVQNAVVSATKELPNGVWDPEHITNSALATLRAGGYHSARRLNHKGVPNRANQADIMAYVNRVIAQRTPKTTQ